MDKLFQKLTQPSLKDMCVQALLEKILSGDLQVGDWLPPERDLAEQMGISRSSVNQAILQLSSQGFLEIVPRRGTVVRDYRKQPTPQSLAAVMTYGSSELDRDLFGNLMEFLLMIETECARLACRHIYENTFAEMTDLAERFAAGDGDPADTLYQFHYRLSQASGNIIYSMLFRAFEPLLRTLISRHYVLQAADIQSSAQMYRRLLDHIRNKDEEKAAQQVRAIINRGILVLQQRYE